MIDNPDLILSRRAVLRRGSCAALGLAGLTGQLLGMRSMAAALDGARFADYRAIVCVFLFGGNDCGNTVVPLDGGPENLDAYAATRPTLALTRHQAEPQTLRPLNTPGRTFALHPALADVAALFEQGHASIVANVGTLLAPTTKAGFESRSVPLPQQLFAHNVQQHQWQLSRPDAVDGLGWGGRIADLLQAHGANADATTSMNISLAGEAVFLAGRQVMPYTLRSPDHAGPTFLDSMSIRTEGVLRQALIDVHAAAADPAHPNPHAMRKTIADIASRAIFNGELIEQAVRDTSIATPLPSGNPLAQQLAHVARLIAIARPSLGQSRQVYFVATGGFDTHDGVIGTDATDGVHAARLAEVNGALRFFWDALGELGMRDQVTTFTASDFGRGLSSNGNGSDHGWGGHHIVMGGAQLAGRRLLGRFPILDENGPDALRRGNLVPSTSVDQYAFEFARWLGVPPSEIATVLPNVARFLDPLDPATHLGLLAEPSAAHAGRPR